MRTTIVQDKKGVHIGEYSEHGIDVQGGYPIKPTRFIEP